MSLARDFQKILDDNKVMWSWKNLCRLISEIIGLGHNLSTGEKPRLLEVEEQVAGVTVKVTLLQLLSLPLLQSCRLTKYRVFFLILPSTTCPAKYSQSSSAMDILTVLSPDFIFSCALYDVTYLQEKLLWAATPDGSREVESVSV